MKKDSVAAELSYLRSKVHNGRHVHLAANITATLYLILNFADDDGVIPEKFHDKVNEQLKELRRLSFR
ncbi:MAG: hypothetical protein WDA18_09660 [Candidatus Ratteibacteria bacterium]